MQKKTTVKRTKSHWRMEWTIKWNSMAQILFCKGLVLKSEIIPFVSISSRMNNFQGPFLWFSSLFLTEIVKWITHQIEDTC